MTQYRKKGGPIEAAQFNGENPMDIVGVVAKTGNFSVNYSPKEGLRFSIGRRYFPIAPGQWVVIEEGRVEIMNDEQFLATYEPVEPPKPPTPSDYTGLRGTTLPIPPVGPLTWGQNGFDPSVPAIQPGGDEYYDIAQAADRGGEIIL